MCCDANCFMRDFCESIRSGRLNDPFHHGAENTNQICFLKGLTAAVIRWNLTQYGDQRARVLHGGVQTNCHIGRTYHTGRHA